MTATKPAAARSLFFDRITGMLRLTVGKSVEAYSVHVLPAGEGVTQVALHKFAADEDTRYVVTLAGDVAVCNCPAGRYGKVCKHTGSVKALVSRGMLAATE